MAAQTFASPNVRLGPGTINLLSDPRGIEAQRVAFWLCCAYVVSQVYLVPIWLVGPSWSVWPSTTDLVIPALLLLLPILHRDRSRISREAVVMKRFLVFLAAGCALSYLVLTLNLLDTKPSVAFNDKGPAVGLYQLYRLCQYMIVFWFALRVELDDGRRRWLCRMVALTFWISSAFLLADYFRLVDTPMLAPHIPKSLAISGPWAFYSRGTVGEPVGTIGFHHVYPSVQLLLLAALYLHLLQVHRPWLTTLIMVCLLVCGFISGSRAGFVAIFLFVGAVVFSHLRRLVAAAVMAAVLMLAFVWQQEKLTRLFSDAWERQGTIGSSYGDDGFAGRVEIWSERVALLNENPLSWLVGTGFGSAIESGNNGHMLYLHITLECGLVGLAAFLVLAWKIMQFLWRKERGTRFLYCATAALLVSALTQETFYPVPALSQFCGAYLFCIAVAIRRPAQLAQVNSWNARCEF
jgi:hypothetical protein